MEEIEEKIDELARMVARGFSETATKADLEELRTELHHDMARLRGDVDIMLDKHIGMFRADYDGLAGRMRTVEDIVRVA